MQSNAFCEAREQKEALDKILKNLDYGETVAVVKDDRLFMLKKSISRLNFKDQLSLIPMPKQTEEPKAVVWL